jgi:hypothetical protein
LLTSDLDLGFRKDIFDIKKRRPWMELSVGFSVSDPLHLSLHIGKPNARITQDTFYLIMRDPITMDEKTVTILRRVTMGEEYL